MDDAPESISEAVSAWRNHAATCPRQRAMKAAVVALCTLVDGLPAEPAP